MNIISSFVNLLYPKRCIICFGILKGAEVTYGVCDRCKKRLPYVKPPYCKKCGKHIESADSEYCFDCSRIKKSYDKGYAVFSYRGVMEKGMMAFKYGNKREFADFYGKEIVKRFGRILKETGADCLIPVPIHSSRRRKRGYNQAELIAKEVSAYLDIPMRDDILVRVSRTVAQKKLDDIERRKNIKKAFKRVDNSVKLDTVILIDDIYTSGATLEACTSVLKATGVKRVYCVSVCIGEDMRVLSEGSDSQIYPKNT